jgi:hypothetical protein
MEFAPVKAIPAQEPTGQWINWQNQGSKRLFNFDKHTGMKILSFCLLLFLPLFLSAQENTVCSLESRERLEKLLEKFSNDDFSKKNREELILEIGKSFLGTIYEEKTLELPGEEKLVINLMGLDCTTYLETVVALEQTIRKKESSFEGFGKKLEQLRYLDGKNTGYSSRLHYFSDWIRENEQKGLLRDITKEIGGVEYPNQPTFMSENPKFYPQLSDPRLVGEIRKREEVIKARSYFYIPKEQIQKLENKIETGDLIAITTPMKNLDIVHVGFAVMQKGRIHLMHASSVSRKVEISSLPLSDYLFGNKSQSGIMVSRLKLP